MLLSRHHRKRRNSQDETRVSTAPAVLRRQRAAEDRDKVFQDETTVTDANGIGRFEFRDRTRLAIGPASTIVLDRFDYDGERTVSRAVIDLSTGPAS